MDIKVSIIVPVYNVEQFLRRCLDSCVNQTLKEIEVIVVNDASPDHSDNIMREYEKKYPEKIRCIYLKKNIRLGGARNTAIRCAKGEFVTFVDSDDWIKAEMCEELYNEARQSSADIVYSNTLGERKDGSFLVGNRFPNEAVGDVDKHILEILTQPYVGAWSYLIKRSLITDNDLYFPEGVVAEDTATTRLWDLHANKIAKVESAYYAYCINTDSIGRARLLAYRSDEYNSVKRLYDNLMKCAKVHEYKTECSFICMRYAMNFTNSLLKRGGANFKEQMGIGFKDCVDYVRNGLEENYLWNYWFTPREKECLLTGINFDCYDEQHQISDIEDYRQYYENLAEEISKILKWFLARGRERIGIWGRTDYTLGLNKVFTDMKIVENASDIDDNKIQCVICLRMLHVPNIKSQLKGKNIELFNLQCYLWTRENISKFCCFLGNSV